MPHRPRPAVICAALLTLLAGGCMDVPELGERVPPDLERADYPRLVPLEPLLGPVVAPTADARNLADQMNARRANLQRRADALNPQVVDPDTRERMSQGVVP